MKNRTVYFGFAGYPEIKKIDVVMMPRDGEKLAIGACLGAHIQVGDFKGICSFSPDSEQAFNFKEVLEYGKRCVEYQRKKQGDLRDSKS